jgi:hypothetical protein
MVLNEQMAIITMYNKARKHRDNTEYIICYLLDDIEQLLA